MSPRLRYRRIYLLLVIFLLSSQAVGAAQSTFGLGAARARKGSAVKPAPAPASEAPKPELLNADTNPTLRYPVAVRESSVSCGWLDVTRIGINYTVVESGRKAKPAYGKKFAGPGGSEHFVAPADASGDEGFALSSSEITDIRLEKNFLRLAFAKRAFYLIYMPQDNWATVAGNMHEFDQLAKRDPMPAGTMAVQRAMQSFANALAEIKPPASPELDVTLHAEPPSVEKGHPVSLVWNSKNATVLDLEPGVGRVSAAGMMSQLPQDSTNYTLTAAGPIGTKTVSVYVTVTAPANPPTVVLIQPPAAADGQTVEVSSSPLVISGVVMDATGIPVVTVNGKPVTLRPTSAQAAQFKSDPIDLQNGENRFEVLAVNTAKAQVKVAFVAHYSPAQPKAPPVEPANPKGLGKAEILSLLQGEVPSARVAELVKQRGIKFVPTPDDLKQIRDAGGGDDLIDAINQAPGAAKN